MRQRLRSKLTYANVMSTLAVVLVIGGGTAAAAVTITSNSQVGPDTISGHKPSRPYHANIISGSVNGTDIATGSVNGTDLADGSVNGFDIANDSVKGGDVGNDSLSLLDIVGADVHSTMNLAALGGNSCTAGSFGAPGAKVGDVALLSIGGGADWPTRLTAQAVGVPHPNEVFLKFCNPTQFPVPFVQGFDYRIITLR